MRQVEAQIQDARQPAEHTPLAEEENTDVGGDWV